MAFTLNRIDTAKQEAGIWKEYEGSSFLIAYSGANFTKRLNTLRKPFERAIQKGTISPENNMKLYAQAVAETILLGWKAVNDTDGNPVEFNVEVAVEALTNDPEFFAFITEVSTDVNNYEKERVAKKQKS